MPASRRMQLDSRPDPPADSSAIDEHGDACAVWEDLASSRPQRREDVTVPEDREPQSVPADPLRDVAVVDEAQLEKPLRAATSHRERTAIESAHDPPSHAEVDHDAHPQPHTDMTHAERPCRQEHQPRMIPWAGSPRRSRTNVDDAFPARRDPDTPRTETEPGSDRACGPHPGLPSQRAREAGPRDVDQHGPAPWIPQGDRCGGRAPEHQPERARAESDAAAGRGTRDGCRGRCENERHERTSHLPITVNVSVAV
jgi:hypothetical protein